MTTPPWLAPNPRAKRNLEFGRAQQRVINPNGVDELCKELKQCPAYKPTPLYSLPALAERLGIGELRVKDESQRFGLGAFKALGGILAVGNVLTGAVGEAFHQSTTFANILKGHDKEITSRFVFATASSGNHGRAVAAGAQLFGNRCIVFLPKFTSAGKEAAIRERGAEVIRVDGDYDAAVAECRRQSEQNGWQIISDTSWEGYESVPKSVMRGYTVLVHEAGVDQWGVAPTHVFVQAGVGGLAAALAAYLWETAGPARPRLVVVEPNQADCVFRTVAAGRPIVIEGSTDTFMACLAAGEVSPVAWDILKGGLDDVIALPDEAAMAAMKLLATGQNGDPPIVAGESGAAAAAGLVAAALDPALRATLGLDRAARVLVIGSEGATDPATYERVVGRRAEDVAG